MSLILLFAVAVAQAAGTADLTALVRLVETRDQARLSAKTPEDAARLALPWLRALKDAAEASQTRALHPSLKRHESLIFYDEIGGSWILNHDAVLALHDRYRATKTADDLAWFAAELRLGGECEGYVPCYMSSVNIRYGEYLRRHSSGAHAREAVLAIMDAIRSSQDLIRRYPDLFKAKEACGDLMAQLPKLEDAVQNADVPEQASASELIHELASRCEPPLN